MKYCLDRILPCEVPGVELTDLIEIKDKSSRQLGNKSNRQHVNHSKSFI
jgi:hypothetical protein